MNDNYSEPQRPAGSSFFDGLRRSGWYRAEPTVFGGVCAGLAHKSGWDRTLIRILAVLSLFTGFGLLLYGLAWLFLPRGRDGEIIIEQAVLGHIQGGLLLGGLFVLTGLFGPIGILGLEPHSLTTVLLVGSLIILVVWLFTNRTGNNSSPYSHTTKDNPHVGPSFSAPPSAHSSQSSEATMAHNTTSNGVSSSDDYPHPASPQGPSSPYPHSPGGPGPHSPAGSFPAPGQHGPYSAPFSPSAGPRPGMYDPHQGGPYMGPQTGPYPGVRPPVNPGYSQPVAPISAPVFRSVSWRFTLLTLAAMLLVIPAVWALSIYNPMLVYYGLLALAAVAGVLAVAMLIASLTGHRMGWMGWIAAGLIFVLATSSSSVWAHDEFLAGTDYSRAFSFNLDIGDTTVDLDDDFHYGNTSDHRLMAGEMTAFTPTDVPTTITVKVGAGSIDLNSSVMNSYRIVSSNGHLQEKEKNKISGTGLQVVISNAKDPQKALYQSSLALNTGELEIIPQGPVVKDLLERPLPSAVNRYSDVQDTDENIDSDSDDTDSDDFQGAFASPTPESHGTPEKE